MSATLTAPPRVRTQSRRLLTAADVAGLPRTLATGDVKYELDDGELVVMAPPGDMHGYQQGMVLHALIGEGMFRLRLGEARGETGVVLRRTPDRVVAPDAVFILNRSLPANRSREGYLETIPELVVEVESKNDSGPELQAKTDEYFAAGVRMVWRLDPDRTTVTVHRPGQPDQVFGPADTLAVDDLLPGFAVPVARLFPAN